MNVKSLRISDDMDKAINYVAQSEKIEKAQSIRKLARLGFEFYVAKSYEKGVLTLRKTAELLNLSLSETIDLLQEHGVKGNIRSKDVLDNLKALST
jgi:predicted HTH domain antitoxin